MADIPREPIEKYGLSKRAKKKTLFSKIGVIGCGNDGSVIATIAASHGIEVVFLEPDEERIKNSFQRIEDKLNAKILHWGLTESEKRTIIGRITGTTNYEDFASCDFAIEAIRYNNLTGERRLEERKHVFEQLEKIMGPSAIIASNVTTVIVSDLASDLVHKDRVVGLHFLSNTPGSRLIEVVKGYDTSEETFNKVIQFAKLINHLSVEVLESAGLVSLRLLLVQLNEACTMLMEGISTVEGMDNVITVGLGHRIGIFRIADRIGIGKIVKLLENMYEEYGDLKYKPSPILLRLARAKHLGVTTKRGFYKYNDEGEVIK